MEREQGQMYKHGWAMSWWEKRASIFKASKQSCQQLSPRSTQILRRSKGMCQIGVCKVGQLAEYDLWNPHGGRRELSPVSYSQTSLHELGYELIAPNTHINEWMAIKIKIETSSSSNSPRVNGAVKCNIYKMILNNELWRLWWHIQKRKNLKLTRKEET